MQLAVACDFRLMSRNAEIQFVQVKMGLTPGWGGGARLVRLLGKQIALQLLGKGEKVDLSHGRRLGLVDGELPHGQVRDAVYRTVKITRSPQGLYHWVVCDTTKPHPSLFLSVAFQVHSKFLGDSTYMYVTRSITM